MAVEAACGLLEAAWLSGQVDAVEAALLPLQVLSGSADLNRAAPATSPCQQQVRSPIHLQAYTSACVACTVQELCHQQYHDLARWSIRNMPQQLQVLQRNNNNSKHKEGS